MKAFYWAATRSAGLAAGAAIVLAACGGGGGGSDQALTVSYSPASVEQTYLQHFDRTYVDGRSPQDVHLNVTFATEPPSDVVAVRVLAPEAVFEPFIIFQGSGRQFTAIVTPDTMLQPGVHEGDATLQLCRDVACTKVISTTGSLHYKFTVQAGLKVTLNVNGSEFTSERTAVPGTAGTWFTVDVPDGVQADFTSTIPVVWSIEGDPSMSQCDSSNSQTIESNASTTSLSVSITKHADWTWNCGVLVRATPVDTSQREAIYTLSLPAN